MLPPRMLRLQSVKSCPCVPRPPAYHTAPSTPPHTNAHPLPAVASLKLVLYHTTPGMRVFTSYWPKWPKAKYIPSGLTALGQKGKWLKVRIFWACILYLVQHYYIIPASDRMAHGL